MFLFPKNVQLGFHFVKTDDICGKIRRHHEGGYARAFQCFLKNPRSFSYSKLKTETLKDLASIREYVSSNRCYFIIHGAYIYNMSSEEPNMIEGTLRCLSYELDLAAVAGAGVIIHMGTHNDEETAINNMIAMCKRVLNENSEYTSRIASFMGMTVETLKMTRFLVLENSSREGNKIGWNMHHIKRLIDGVVDPRVGLCIDTAHIHGAGVYSLRDSEGVDKMFNDMRENNLLDRLEVIHLNDSKVSLGSRVDRHEDIGYGKIWGDGCEGVKHLISICETIGIPMVCEPTKGDYRDSYEYLLSEDALHDCVESIRVKISESLTVRDVEELPGSGPQDTGGEM
jgi:deoxyribonuclease IV